MINITRKEECCGCQACGDICPKGSISFKTDEEGIWYPEVNQDTCIECHLCEKVCPIINKVSRPDNSIDPITYILQAPNPVDRLKSASGGAYTLLINEVFNRGGYVAGHIWNDKTSVKGYISCKPEDLDILRGTKYLQSDIEGIYKAVKHLLNEGKFVLFSGCPCQTAAMRSFLKKDYDNLLMTDFVCMGIDSPLAFKKYIESLESHYNSKMVFFKAKSKEVGWRYLTNKAQFENGKSYFGINNVDANLKATFLNILVRPSCYECRFKSFPRVSDMTIGDYWRKSKNYDHLDDNTGTSYVLLHNDKAVAFFDSVKSKCNLRQETLRGILGANPLAIKSLDRPVFSREEFYQRLHNEDFISLVNDYSNVKEKKKPLWRKIKAYIRRILEVLMFYKNCPGSLLAFIYYNFLCRKIKSSFTKGDLLLIKHTKLNINKGAKVIIKGVCKLEADLLRSNIYVGQNSVLSINNATIKNGVLIKAHENTSISIGFKTVVDDYVSIKSGTGVNIGDFSYICDRVIIDDNNNDVVYFNNCSTNNRFITIGTHVLINRGSVIRSGCILGDEVIVKENSVVEGSFEHHKTIAGNPAQDMNVTVNWKYNF